LDPSLIQSGVRETLKESMEAGCDLLEALLAWGKDRGQLSPTIYVPLRRGEPLPKDVVARRV
jgi:hypothetical protein